MDLVEKVAALEHEQWAHWMRYLEKKVHWKEGIGWVISEEVIIEWQRKTNAGYDGLTEEEKESDRLWARRVLSALGVLT